MKKKIGLGTAALFLLAVLTGIVIGWSGSRHSLNREESSAQESDQAPDSEAPDKTEESGASQTDTPVAEKKHGAGLTNQQDEKKETESDKTASEEEEPEGDEQTQMDITPAGPHEATDEKDVWNLVLIGQDKREGEDRQRSDSMMICSINFADHTVRLVSIMRDMYVDIPRYGSNRINAAYSYGGMELLDETLLENFGVQIDGNVEVDFDGFIETVAQVGPIVIELSAEEAAYLNSIPFAELSEDAQYWHLSEGLNQLEPEQALAYARTRFVGNADFERTERQRKILASGFENIRGKSQMQKIALLRSMMPYLETDLTFGELTDKLMDMSAEEDVQYTMDASYRLPVSGTFHTETINGMSVIVPDTEANAAYLHSFLYEGAPMPEPTQEDAAIEMDIALGQKGKISRPSAAALVENRKRLMDSMGRKVFENVAAYVAIEDAKWSMLFAWPYFVESLEDKSSPVWDFVDKNGDVVLKDIVTGEDIITPGNEDATAFIAGMENASAVAALTDADVAADLQACADAMKKARDDHDSAALLKVWQMLTDMDHYLFNYDATDQSQLTRTYFNTLQSLEGLE